jgi:hypothetical protein
VARSRDERRVMQKSSMMRKRKRKSLKVYMGYLLTILKTIIIRKHD